MYKDAMDNIEPLYCFESCRNSPRVRSFGVCPECNNIWDTSTKESSENTEHYRNNAWKLCKSCSIKLNRCVVCGEPV